VKGRRITYIFTFIIFFGACVGLAETKSYSQLLVIRCLQSTGSASTIVMGAGVIGDITTREERDGYMGIFQAGLLVPSAVGPVIYLVVLLLSMLTIWLDPWRGVC